MKRILLVLALIALAFSCEDSPEPQITTGVDVSVALAITGSTTAIEMPSLVFIWNAEGRNLSIEHFTALLKKMAVDANTDTDIEADHYILSSDGRAQQSLAPGTYFIAVMPNRANDFRYSVKTVTVEAGEVVRLVKVFTNDLGRTNEENWD